MVDNSNHPLVIAHLEGWSAFPVKAGSKDKPLVEWKQFQERIASAQEIENWIAKWPDCNSGIVTGKISGFIVLDVDGTEGWLSLTKFGTVPRTISVNSPRGRHYYFKHPGIAVINKANRLPGLDSRGDGGYIIGAGSKRPEGKYTWSWAPDEAEMAYAPDWWLELVVRSPEDQPPPPTNSFPPVSRGTRSKYALSALQSEMDILRASAPHAHNDALNRAAFNMGTLVGAGLLNQTHVEAELQMAARDIGQKPKETLSTIKSGLNAGMKKPRLVVLHSPRLQIMPAPLSTSTNGKDMPIEEIDPGDLLRDAHLTDAGNAECMIALHRDDFRYCHSREKWLQWDNARWLLDSNGEADRVALSVIKARQVVALDIQDKEQFTKTMAALKRAEDDLKRRAMLRTASILHPYTSTIEQYDTHDWLAATRKGTIELRTGQFRPARRTDLLTQQLGATYDKTATCPRWTAFLSEIFSGNTELQGYIQRAIGYSLTGDTSEQKLFLLYGVGANGKSVFLETLAALFGDYAANTPFITFDADKHSEMSNDLAALKGKRFVTVIETDENRRLAEARVKAVTGQDRITCRFLHKEFFTYKPTWKLWLAMNHKPIIRGTDRGIWRRIKLIPYLENFEGREEPQLTDKLLRELPGILNWALQGLADWRTQGLGRAEVIEAATEAYRNESDLVGQWLSENVEKDERAFLSSLEGYRSYRYWCKTWGHRETTATTWGRSMSERGYHRGAVQRNPVTKKPERGYMGLQLLVVTPVENY